MKETYLTNQPINLLCVRGQRVEEMVVLKSNPKTDYKREAAARDEWNDWKTVRNIIITVIIVLVVMLCGGGGWGEGEPGPGAGWRLQPNNMLFM